MPLIDRLNAAWRATSHAAELLASRAAEVDPILLAVGVVLHFAAIAVRQRGWLNILRAAQPEATALRLRDVESAYFAGAGLNGVLPARGGDAIKLVLLRRRMPGASYTTLAATFVPETLFETLCGAALVVWALSMGLLPVPAASGELPSLDVSTLVAHPFLWTALAAGGVLAVVVLRRVLGDRLRGLARRARQGVAILRRPRQFITGVVGWQALGRLIRLGSLACLMAAFGLPVTLATVLLVMAAQGGTRIIPLAPAGSGVKVLLLSYGLVELTGHTVDVAAVTAFAFGTGAVLLACGLAISLAILASQLGTWSPRRALAAARPALPETAPDPAGP